VKEGDLFSTHLVMRPRGRLLHRDVKHDAAAGRQRQEA
jgi:hypothetical protein